jgi:RNA polymerase sigma factor (sigma-70 family)
VSLADPPTEFPPESWAARLRSGEEAALGGWYQAEYPVVRRLCLGFLANGAEADNQAQEALFKLHQNLTHWDHTRPYAAWRNTLVANCCRDRLRSGIRRQQRERAQARPEATHMRPGQSLEQAEFEADLERALTALSPREREVFVLIDLEEIPAAEAAQQLQIKASSLRAYLSLARSKLRQHLAAHAPEPGRPA